MNTFTSFPFGARPGPLCSARALCNVAAYEFPLKVLGE